MSRVHRIPAALILAGATVLGATGIAQAQPAIPPALAGLLDSGSAALGSSAEAPAPDAPRLASVPNFRDVAGTGAGYAGDRGAHLNKGVFYRSDALVPNDADLATLEGLKLSEVIDLRTDQEVADKADRLPAGVTYTRVPILSGNINDMVAKIKSPEDARNMMRQMNVAFATGDAERAAFKTELTDLANASGPSVFHCTAGKDRTGWTAMLLQSIAGVDDATIMQDYLLTNEYNKDWAAKTRAYIASTQGEQVALLFEPLLGVESSYLQSGLDAVKTNYGSIDKYLTDGVGLSADTIAKLKAKLLR